METANPTISSSTDSERSNPRGGGKYAAATLVVLSLVATFSPVLAASLLGVAIQWDGQRSTGGVIALVASVAMWIWCRNWEVWRQWIWLPAIVTVVIAFAIVGAGAAGGSVASSSSDNSSMDNQSSTPSGLPAAPPPASDAQQACESQGYTWDLMMKCITTVGQELRSQGWGSTEARVGRLYYSFGGDATPCGDRLCQTLIFHSDDLSSCPGGIIISPNPGHEGIDAAKIDQLGVNSEAQISLKVPLGAKNIYFAYDWACK